MSLATYSEQRKGPERERTAAALLHGQAAPQRRPVSSTAVAIQMIIAQLGEEAVPGSKVRF